MVLQRMGWCLFRGCHKHRFNCICCLCIFREFFKISDDFDPTTMVMRHNRTVFFQSCPMAKSLINYNRNKVDSNVCMELFYKICILIVTWKHNGIIWGGHVEQLFIYIFIYLWWYSDVQTYLVWEIICIVLGLTVILQFVSEVHTFHSYLQWLKHHIICSLIHLSCIFVLTYFSV